MRVHAGGMFWKQDGSSAAANAVVQLYFPSNSLSPREEYVFNWCDTSTTGVELLVCREGVPVGLVFIMSTEQLSWAMVT